MVFLGGAPLRGTRLLVSFAVSSARSKASGPSSRCVHKRRQWRTHTTPSCNGIGTAVLLALRFICTQAYTIDDEHHPPGERLPWCKAKGESTCQWTALYHDKSSVLYVEGKPRMHGDDVPVRCGLPGRGREADAPVEMDDPKVFRQARWTSAQAGLQPTGCNVQVDGGSCGGLEPALCALYALPEREDHRHGICSFQ